MTGATFKVHRDIDHSNVSGVGVVAEGWESSDGKTVVLVWLSATPSVCIYTDIRHIEAIHGHGGDTRIVFDRDEPELPIETQPSNDNPGLTWDSHDDPEVN